MRGDGSRKYNYSRNNVHTLKVPQDVPGDETFYQDQDLARR